MSNTSEKKKGRSWPISIFVVYVVFVGMFIAVYIVGSRRNNDLVAENYYEQELKYQDRIDQMKNVHSLDAIPTAGFDISRQDVVIGLPAEVLTDDLKGMIYFTRDDNSALDFKQVMKLNADAKQSISMQGRPAGKWSCAISWTNASKKYYWKTVIVF